MNRKSIHGSESHQVRNPSCASFPKCKVFSDKNLRDMESVMKHGLRELVGGHACQLWCEFQKYDFVDARRFEPRQFFFGTREESEIHMRSQHLHGMRIKCQDERGPLRRSSRFHHRL